MNKERGRDIVLPDCHREFAYKRVGSGTDSVVYQFGNLALKVYEQTRNLKLINEYFNITNRAAKLTMEEDFFLELPNGKEKFPIRVNPYLKIFECKSCKIPYGFAPYVSGRRLDCVTSTYGKRHSAYWERHEDYMTALNDFGDYLEKRLKVKGIGLTPCNIKILSQKELVITDLCGDIRNLKVH